jgi:acetylcholinesterase
MGTQSLHATWTPRTDGVFLTDDPQKLVQQGKVAKIPYVTGKLRPPCTVFRSPQKIYVGNCDDEGTLFSLANVNVTLVILHRIM